jgi:hypothetical protein
VGAGRLRRQDAARPAQARAAAAALGLPLAAGRRRRADRDRADAAEKGNGRDPRRRLVYYRVGAEGDNWEGVSLLRPVYKPWYIKDQLERLDAVGREEREALGLPSSTRPAGTETDRRGVLDSVETRWQRWARATSAT